MPYPGAWHLSPSVNTCCSTSISTGYIRATTACCYSTVVVTHVHIPLWPVRDVVQDVTFASQEDDNTGHDYLCTRTRALISPTAARPLTLDPLDKPRQVVVLPPLFTIKLGARLSTFYNVWRRERCSKWMCDVLEVSFRLPSAPHDG